MRSGLLQLNSHDGVKEKHEGNMIMKIRTFFLIIISIFQMSYGQIYMPVTISAQKQIFLMSEPIRVRVAIKNPLGELIYLDTSYYFARHLRVIDQNNRLYELKVNFEFNSACYIAPGDSMIRMYDITSDFGNMMPASEKEFYGLPEGSYTIEFKMKQKEMHFESNKLRVSIIPPSDEEREVFILYNNARFSFFQKAPNKTPQEVISACEMIAQNYPHSVYTPGALSLARSASMNDSLTYQILGEKILQKYPDSYQSWDVIIASVIPYRSNKDKIGVENFLKEIITKSPGTFAAQEAQYWLAKIEPLTLEEWLNPELATERRLKEYYEKQQKH